MGRKAAPTARYLGHPNKASNAERARDLDLFDLAIDSNLRAGDLPNSVCATLLLLDHTKLESTVLYLGIEVDDALKMVEQTEV